MKSGGLWQNNIFKESTIDSPLISVVTVTYNAQLHLSQTLESIENQTYDHIELIIIDGGSTDKTLDIIEKYSNFIDYWVSEPDNGIYDAMNKGLKLARGKWICFKNADDWFCLDAIENFVRLSKIYESEIFYGNTYSVLKEFPLKVSPFFTDHKTLGQKPGIDHRSTFFLTDFHKLNPYDLSFKLAADFDVYCRMREKGARFVHINSFISYKRFGGASDGIKILKETFAINNRFIGFFGACLHLSKNLFSYYLWRIGNRILKFALGEQVYFKFKGRNLKLSD
jgi:glycosyltransferase involved in cell wall biosynthesis